jgi:hypothetical protein
MRKVITNLSLIICVFLLADTAALSGKPGSLPGQAKFRGKSLEEWGVLASEWQVASGLGDASNLSDTVQGVRLLPPTIGGGEFEFDVTLEAGTAFELSSFFVFGEKYDNGTEDDPADPIIPIIFETTSIETALDGRVVLEGTTSDFEDLLFGPVAFDQPIIYSVPQPRGPGLNAVAATFVVGVGSVYPPLPVGKHTLENTIDSLFFGPTHVIYNITVVPHKK